MNDDRLISVTEEHKRLSRLESDYAWDDDPRLAQVVRELNRYKKLMEEGVLYDPKF